MRLLSREVVHMSKEEAIKIIMEMLIEAEEKQVERVLYFIKAFLG